MPYENNEIYRRIGYGMDDSETPYLNGYEMKQETRVDTESMTVEEAYGLKLELEKKIEDLIDEFEEDTDLDVHAILLWRDDDGNHVDVEAVL